MVPAIRPKTTKKILQGRGSNARQRRTNLRCECNAGVDRQIEVVLVNAIVTIYAIWGMVVKAPQGDHHGLCF